MCINEPVGMRKSGSKRSATFGLIFMNEVSTRRPIKLYILS